MRFGILGRLEVTGTDARVVALPAGRQRALLAALLYRANRVVSADSLADTVWDGAPPGGAATTIRSYVMRLRRVLGPEIAARIETRDPGYLIRVAAGELDADVLEALHTKVGSAIAARTDWGPVAAEAAEALALRRETPLIDVPSRALRDAWLPGIEQQLLQLGEWRLTAEVELGNGQLVLPEIRTLVQRQPLREQSHRLLMLSLAQAGHTGEALTAYRDARAVLVDQLGVEPGADLTDLHRRILAGEVGSRAVPAAARPAMRTGPIPRQLPNDVRTFVGRRAELGRLTALAEARDTVACETVVLTMIEGMGGAGKSTLAVHAAHRVSARFPDGQLFVDLRGHTPGLSPMPPQDALEWLLRSMDVPVAKIPHGLAERAALYRSTLTGTRTLILLDNAASAAQVRPLIPAEPGCLVLVTSRTSLAGLDDAHFVGVGLLPDAEALELLFRAAGPGRVPVDDPAAVELVRLCGGLPLAIRIAAAHLRHRSGLSIADYVARLGATGDRLELLSDEDRSLSAVFASSFEGLPPDAQRLFRFLGLVPGPDFDAYAAAHLLDRDPRTAEYLLEFLLGHNLVLQRTPGRYSLHDLVRSYARKLALDERADTACGHDIQGAWERLMDYYEQAAEIADSLRESQFMQARRDPAAPLPAHLPEFADRVEAAAWLRAERANILAAIADAEASGAPERVIELTRSITGLLYEEGPQDTAAGLHAAAADSARALGRPERAAHHLLALGESQRKAGMSAESSAALGQARSLYRSLGKRRSEAYTLYCLGRSSQAVDDASAAAGFFEEALELAREMGDLRTEASVLTTLGRMKQAQGEMAESLDMKERALALFRKTGSRQGEGSALYELGRTIARLGDLARAAEIYQDALAIFLEIDYPNSVAHTHWELGRLRVTTGEFVDAQEHFERADEVFEREGYRVGTAFLQWEFGRVSHHVGRPREAVPRYRRALAAFRDVGMPIGEANVLHELGRTRHRLGGRKTAVLLLNRSLELFRLVGDPDGQAEVFNTRGACAAESGDPQAALAFHLDALDLAGTADSPLEQARAYEGAARSRWELGERGRALADLREAVQLYRRIGAVERHDAAALLTRFEAGVVEP